MIYFMRFPGGRAKALTFSYDDGVEQDIRLIDIFNHHNLRGTFNINTGSFAPEGTVYAPGTIHRRMTEKRACELYANSPHEVAVHTLTHPFLEQLPANRIAYEVLGDRKNIEKLFGKITRGMAYPCGTYSDTVVEVLKACGIVYSRTTKTTDNFQIPTDWLRLSATCHHNSPNLMNLGKKFAEDKPTHAPWLFYVWGHSYEFEAKDNWNVIEDFADLVAFHDDVWYATNIEIYDYCQAYQSLLFSADGSAVFNPSCYELFFCNSHADRQLYSVKPGETLILD